MRAPAAPRHRSAHAGQSVVEFAIMLPVVMLLLIAIADFGRLYTSAVAVESAAREAADYGSFQSNYWSAPNVVTTVDRMQYRACIAASGSHLEGYQSSDPTNHTCTNPSFTCNLEHGSMATDCASSGGWVNGVDCSQPATAPPCIVHVRLDYEFRTLLGIAPLPTSLQIGRDSRFRISDLAPPP
jgi:Flp pilus assembly protein TadG